jgi:Exopolysaccharide biosynthesis protein YbjH
MSLVPSPMCLRRQANTPAGHPPGRPGPPRGGGRRLTALACGQAAGVVLAAIALLTLTLASGAARSQEVWDQDLTRSRTSVNDFGGVGLLQTRSARMSKDGQFTFGMAFSDPYDRYSLTWQILPWAEAIFRYDSDAQRGSQGIGRGADLKFQLFEETADSPEIAVGFQDLIGTGLFDSEYLVSSKRYGDFDFSLGVVWGYSAGSNGLFNNPLRLLSQSFKTRGSPGGQGGNLRLTSFFSGKEIDLFGGVEYHTPIDGLSLKAEYDPNDYKLEPSGPLEQDFPVNVGINYRPWDWLDVGVAFERGNTLMTRVALRADLNAAEWMQKVADPPPPPLAVRPGTRRAHGLAGRQLRTAAPVQVDNPKAVAANIDLDLVAAEIQHLGLDYEGLDVEGSTATIRVKSQSLALIEAKLKGLAPILVAAVPAEVTGFRFIVETSDGQRRQFTHSRREMTDSWLVDVLFDRLARQRLQLQSLEVTRGRAVLRVTADEARSELDFLIAARAIRDLLPLVTETVTVIELRGGTDDASLVLNVADDSHVYRPHASAAPSRPDAGDGPTPLTPDQVNEIGVKIFDAMPAHGLTGEFLYLTRRTASVIIRADTFPEMARNIGRAARIVSSYVPESVEEITVVVRASGIDVLSVTLLRRHLEDAVLGFGSPEEVLRSARIERPRAGPPRGATVVENTSVYPRLDWGFGPELRPSIGAPEDPFLFRIWALLTGHVELLPGFRVGAEFGANIYDNFDQITRGPKGRLPHVRSNIRKYLQKGPNSLLNLQADYVFSPAPDWFARAAVGYFEMMFGGISGEVLYRRQAARWAIGLELSHVWQRNFDQGLGFQDYNVTTGHLSLYYKLPWHGLEATVHGGRYLAGDWGATFQLARRFKGGITVGGFFTLTDASAADFGEGSFDKGFFFSIPLNAMLPYSSRSALNTVFRPLTSDGGQMLNVGPKLYPTVEEGQFDGLDRDWGRLLD